MFCFWLPTIQWLAPKMFQWVTIESCKTIQASFNKLQEGGIPILNLPSFWVGARPWLCLEKQETQTTGDACLLLIHVECLVVPQVLPASTASLHLHGRPALRGQHTIVLPAKSSIIQWHFWIENNIWKGLSQAKSSTAVYSLNLKQCKIDYFCSLCKLQMALILILSIWLHLPVLHNYCS